MTMNKNSEELHLLCEQLEYTVDTHPEVQSLAYKALDAYCPLVDELSDDVRATLTSSGTILICTKENEPLAVYDPDSDSIWMCRETQYIYRANRYDHLFNSAF